MARGLGWKTNAALRADLATGLLGRVPDPNAFETYLKEHDFRNLAPMAFIHAISRATFPSEYSAIESVMSEHPDLATGGYGLPGHRSQPRAEREAELNRDRNDMLTPERLGQFARARAYLEPFGKRQTFNPKVSSYGLKHRAERFHRDRGVEYFYISNGMFIAAALDLGFKVKPDGIKALLNIASKAGGSESTKSEQPFVPLPRGARKRAWSNTMIAAINAGLAQGLFGLEAGDNRWEGNRAKYRFTIGGGIPAIASVTDAGFGELAIDVLVNPRGEGEDSVGVHAWWGFWAKVSDAQASGWLERAKGHWLQTGSGPMGYFRRDIVPALASVSVQPKGYSPTGRFMM